MRQAIIQRRLFLPNIKFGTGAVPDKGDNRDYKYDDLALGAAPVDWSKGYDIERELDFIVPFKNQGGSSSCVGQAWSYYAGIINLAEINTYSSTSAKAYYSQIYLPGGGAYLREGGKLTVNWGAIPEMVVPSYMSGNPPTEKFITDSSWKNNKMDKLAEVLQAKEYRTISASKSMELFAQAIRDNYGVVGGVYGSNNGSWNTNEPKPPANGQDRWGHAIYFGKFGEDSLGKYIATPNSWGVRNQIDTLHRDDWQKLRKDYFSSGSMFNPWTLTDKPNKVETISPETKEVMLKNEKKFIIEAEGAGRKGIVINNKLRLVAKERESAASIYVQANNGQGIFISSNMFNEMPRDKNF